MRNRAADAKGVTLVELVVAIAVASIVILASFTILASTWKTYNMNLHSTVGQQSLREAMVKLTKEVRKPANAVEISGAKLRINGADFTVSGGYLCWGTQKYAGDIRTIGVSYADDDRAVIQIDLTSVYGNTLSTRINNR